MSRCREIESKLRSLDIFSAWRRLPDVQVGIVHVKSDQKLDEVVALLSRTTTARVGVSAAFGDLRDTPRALHVAQNDVAGPNRFHLLGRGVRRLPPGHRCR